jgi:hypothetical protein
MIQIMEAPELALRQDLPDIESLTQQILLERQKRLNLTKELIFEKQKNKQLEEFIDNFWKDPGKGAEIPEEPIELTPEMSEVKVGTYPEHIRKMKIKKYKQKVKKYRNKVHVSRDFKGRSIAAKLKPRFNGKFAKKLTQI